MTDPLAVLSTSDGTITSALNGDGVDQLQASTLPQFLPRQRWFGAKDRAITSVRLRPLGELEDGVHALVAADVRLGEETQRYLLPLAVQWSSDDSEPAPPTSLPALARIKAGARSGTLVDSALHPDLARALLEGMRNNRQLQAPDGSVVFAGTDRLRQHADFPAARPLGAEQSNVSIAFGNEIILKLYRRLRPGEQPDVEVARFLTGAGQFRNAPAFLGEIMLRPDRGEATTLAAAFAFVPNQGDAWAFVTTALTQSLLGSSDDDGAWIGTTLGQRTAEMHKSLAVKTSDPDFHVEALERDDVAAWVKEAVEETHDLLDRLQAGLSVLSASARIVAEEVLRARDLLVQRIEATAAMSPSGGRSRIHGDYHLGQVLITNRDVMIIDFEGEPKRSLAERRAKSSPLRDVAGMLRSFHYAAWTALDRYRHEHGTVPDAVRARVMAWQQRVAEEFLAAYQVHVAGASSYPTDADFARALTDLFVLQKAIYEVGYELANRPDWVEIPLSGIRDLLNEG